jgi:hypothetical protein
LGDDKVCVSPAYALHLVLPWWSCPHGDMLFHHNFGRMQLDCLSVDDPALRVVATCTSTSLRSLSLARCTSITDAGVAALAQLHQLQDLDISGCTRVTGVISAAPGAQEVMQAGDSALATTSSLPGGLHVLTLKGCTGFSDQGLIKLAQAGGVSSLKSINLGGSGVTNTGLEALTQVGAG